MKKDFYVYEWFNVNNGEVFYVGKGRNNRYKNIVQRNNYFKNYYNKYKCDVRIIKTNLEENEAFEVEIELIKQYRQQGQCQCNISNGGEGSTLPYRSRSDLLRKLQYAHDIQEKTSIMSNEEDYEYSNLKEKSLEELEEMYDDYIHKLEGIPWFNSLDIYDRNGNLNIGWECFED